MAFSHLSKLLAVIVGSLFIMLHENLKKLRCQIGLHVSSLNLPLF